jgi:hypothetical protein
MLILAQHLDVLVRANRFENPSSRSLSLADPSA